MENGFKRFLSLALAIIMVLSNVPVSALASEVADCPHTSVQISNTATCTTDGETITTCLTCNEVISTIEALASGHNYVDGVCACGEMAPVEVEEEEAPQFLAEEEVVATDAVAKVGETEYATIDEAIANWTNGTTLTLLSDVTLTDVIKLSSTEMHTLDLGTYTMTAAKGKDAIQIVNNGRTSASYALDIKADSTNPGGITATGKAVVRHSGSAKDRPITRFYGGVFNASYIVHHSGNNGSNSPSFYFYGGEFNGTIYTNRSTNIFYGGTFTGSLQMSVDSSAYTLIAGGTFKQLSNLYSSSLNSGKFTIGSAKGVYDKEVYVDDNGYYVVAAAKPAEGIEAAVAKKPGTNDYLAYSKVATEGQLNYTDAEIALKNNTSATVTVYADQLDMSGINFKGTIVVPEGEALTVTNAPANLKVTDENGVTITPNANGTYTTVEPEGSITIGYTSTTGVWGEGGGNAFTSLEVQLYAGDTKIASAKLNNIGGIINGDVYVTWHIPFAGSNDEYWNVEWAEGHPTKYVKPTTVKMIIDGVEVARNSVQMNGPDGLNPVEWEKLEATQPDVAMIGTKGYKTLADAVNAIATDGSDTTIKLLTDVELDSSVVFNYGTGKVTFTADEPVTVKQTKVGLDLDFSLAQAANIVVDKNVTFEIYDNASGMYVYYGPSLTVNGAITGGQNWGCLYLFNGDHLVSETGKVAVGRIQTAANTMTVNGEVDTNYLLVEGATFTADGAIVDANVIFDNNNGGQRWGASQFVIKNGSNVNTNKLTLSYADSTLTIDTSSSLKAAEILGKGKIIIDGANFAGNEWIIAGDASKFEGTVEIINNPDLKYEITASGIVVKAKAYVAKIGDAKFESLAEAIAAVQNGQTITLMADIAENVTLTEAVGLTYTIDGNGKTMNGSFTINSLSDTNDNRRITIKNINFVDTADANVDFISSVNTNHYPRITVEGCTFTGSGNDGDVAIRLKSSDSVVITGCTGTGLHSFLQNTSGWNLTIENVTVTASKCGMALGTVQGVTVKGCTIDVAGYGIRMDAQYNNNAVIDSNTVKAFIPVVVRKASVDSSITFNGTNTMTATNTDGKWCVIGVDEYEKNGNLPTADNDTTVTVTVNDAGLDKSGIWNNVLGAGTWGGIDWVLDKDGTLTIAPTKGEPALDPNAPTKRVYAVGEWREAVVYKSNGSASAIGGYPYDVKAVKKLIIKEGVTKIGSFTAQFPNLTGEVIIPSTVTYIGQEAFHKAPITKLTFAAGGTDMLCIANGAFKKTLIEEVILPKDREAIHVHHWAFGGSANLKSAYIPANITKIWGGEHVDYFDNFNSQTNPSWINDGSMFTGCTKMESITFENEDARDLFFKYNVTNEDYIVAYVGMTAYNTLYKAVEDAENDVTVKLVKNVTLTDTLTIPAGKTITLDLNGKTISQSKACTESYEMINNKGNLTITGNGKISFTDTSAGDPSFGWGSYTIRNEGTLVVENGTIEHKGAQAFATHMICAIFQYSGSTTINGGTISTPNYRSVRLWKGDITINGGTFEGQVWVQCVDETAELTIKGGTFAPRGADGSSVFIGNVDNAGKLHEAAVTIMGGTFTTKIGANNAAALNGPISAGTFTETAKNGTNAALLDKNSKFGEADANGYYGLVGKIKVATIGDAIYESLSDAIAAAESGAIIELHTDVEASEVILIGKSLTINGNGHKVTSNATRVFRLTASGIEVILNGVNMVSRTVMTYPIDIRGISIDAALNNVKLTLNDSSVDFTDASACDWAYAVNVSGNGTGHTVTVNGGTYEGANVINVHGANNTVVVKNATLNSLYPNNDLYYGACIWVLQKQNSSVEATGNTFSGNNAIAFNLGTGTALTESNNTDNTKLVVAKVGTEYFSDLAAAFAAAQDGDTVKVLQNVDLAESITNTKKVTLDLNGKTITGTDNATGSFALIEIQPGAELVINDTAGNGKITLTSTNNRGWNAYSSVISNQRGKLIVNGGTIEHLGGTDMAYGIDILTNTGNQNAEAVIYGGVIKSTYRAIRQFLNSTKAVNSLTVNGGTIEGANKSIWVQDANTSANPGALTVSANATLNGDVYLYATAGSTEWPVDISIAASAVNGEVISGNIPSKLAIANVNGVYGVYNSVATNNGVGYATVQAAVDACVAGDNSIILLTDCDEDITILQQAGINITIDGDDMAFTGTINIHGNSNYGSETLTIKNVQFETTEAKHDFIWSDSQTAPARYAHNVTIENCYFSAMGAAKNSAVALRIRQAQNIQVIDCSAYGLHSVIQATGCAGEGIIVEGLNAISCKNGISVGTSNLKISDSYIATTGADSYGVRADAKGEYTVNVEDCSIKAYIPVLIRNTTAAGFTLNVEGNNTLKATNDEGYLAVFSAGDVDADHAPVAPSVDFNLSGLDRMKVFPMILEGSGTESDPYLISNVEELEFFKASVNAGETKYNAPGVWVALNADIDLEGTTWTEGIGDGHNWSFDGNFDGKDHTISNLTITPYADASKYFCGGLFGYTYGGVTIKNLVLDNINVTATGEGHNVGILVGFANNNGGKLNVSNVSVKNSSIDAPNAYGAGAIVGYSYRAMGTIENCHVENAAITGYSFVGGITGYSYSNAIITDCSVKNINIIATHYSAGGIAGLVNPNNTISGCTVENVTIDAEKNVGSVVGALGGNNVTVEDCVAAEPMVGGCYTTNEPVQAKVGDIYYASYTNALAATVAGDTITLLTPIVIAAGETVEFDLNGKTITGTDTATGSFALITNRGNLTIKDSVGGGKITLTATNNRGWNAYSSVISNTVGGKLTVESGVIEHLGGTDMAYGIDNLTNGKGTYAETIINGGTVKSTYRAIRQFLNGVEAQNILTVNGGTIEGANKSIWMQDPSKNANTGKLTVSENATLNGDVYLFVTAGSTEWPVEVSIGAAALKNGATVTSGNVPEGYCAALNNGVYTVQEHNYVGVYTKPTVYEDGFTTFTCSFCGDHYDVADDGSKLDTVATIGETKFATLAAAIAAAKADDTITFVADITEDVTVSKNVTIDGADFNYTGTMTLNNVNVTIENVNFVKGQVYKHKSTGLNANITIKNSTFDGEGLNGYAVNLGGTNAIVIENVTASDYGYGFLQVPSSNVSLSVTNVTISDVNYGLKIDYSNGVTLENVVMSDVTVGVYDSNFGAKTYTIKNCELTAISIWERSAAKTTTFEFEGENTVGTLSTSQYAKYVLAAEDATLTAPESAEVTTIAAGYEVEYHTDKYVAVPIVRVAEVNGVQYKTLAAAIAAAEAGDTITFLADITEDVTVSKNVTIDGADKTYTGKMSLTSNKGTVTIKNVNFDGKGYNGYAVETRGVYYVTIEECTATNYGYGFIQLASSTVLTTVKDVTVSNMNYGVKVDYSTEVVLENVDMTAGVAAVLNSNYGEKTVTIKNSKLNILGTWKRNDTNKTIYVFEGENTVGEFKTEAALDTIKLATAESTLTAPAGQTVTTDVEGCEVEYTNGVYNVVEIVRVALNTKTGIYYASVSDALNAAANGQTVKMLTSSEVDILMIPAGITLDLNGYQLEADYVVSFNDAHIVDNSKDNSGRLIVESNRFMISKTNAHLPVKTDTGYMFASAVTFAEKWSKNNYYISQAYIESTVHEILMNDLEESGVSIVIRLSWVEDVVISDETGETEKVLRTQDFGYSKALVQKYLASYDSSTGKFGKQFELKLNGEYDNITFTYQTLVKSNTGVEFCSSGYTK